MNAIEFLKQLVQEIEKMENSGQVDNEKQEKPAINLTEQQKTAIRGMIAEGYLWTVRLNKNHKLVHFYSGNPLDAKEVVYETYTLSHLYDFVSVEPLYLPDLLGGEE